MIPNKNAPNMYLGLPKIILCKIAVIIPPNATINPNETFCYIAINSINGESTQYKSWLEYIGKNKLHKARNTNSIITYVKTGAFLEI